MCSYLEKEASCRPLTKRVGETWTERMRQNLFGEPQSAQTVLNTHSTHILCVVLQLTRDIGASVARASQLQASKHRILVNSNGWERNQTRESDS